MSKVYFFLSVLTLSFGLFGQAQLPVNCNLAVPGCSTPSFPIVGSQPSYNTVDFTSGSFSNPSSNPQGVNSGCLLSGETVSTFITINIVSSGTLQWSMIGTSGGCFDWIMWPMPNSSLAQTCAGVNGNSLAPVACNWNGTCNGNTGMAAAGNLPPNGSPSSYQPPLNVTAGQSYLLCLSNYSFTNQNVNLNFFGSANVSCSVSAPDQTICLGSSATVNISTPGLTTPQFTWLTTTGVSNTSAGSNVIVSPTVTTTYSVQVVQSSTATSSAFIDTATFTITVVPPPTPNAGIDDTVCLGQPIFLNGTISSATNTPSWQFLTTGITPTPTVSFSPNFNSLTPTVTVNQPGLYQFILRENNTVCGIVRDTVRVLVAQISQTTSTVSPSCAGLSDGEIHINSPFADEYSFDNGVTWQVDSFALVFAAGTYSVCSRNNLGCQTCTNVTVVDPPAITISTSNDTLICQNGNASMWASATGGTSYSFHWDHTTDLSPNQVVSPLVNTTYTVFAENQNGCESVPETVVVTIREPISGTITPDVTICPGYPTQLTATATGGIGVPFTFTWSSGDNGQGGSHVITANPSVSTPYTVTITDNCESTPLVLSTNVILAPLPVPQIAVNPDNKCEPAEFMIVNTTDPNLSDYVYWQISDGQVFVNQDTIYTAPMWEGQYNVQLIVTSPFGCIDSTTFYNFLTVHPKPVADFNSSPSPVLMFNTQVQLTNYSTNGSSYEWFIESGSPAYSQTKHLQTTFPDGVPGEYDVMLITTSEFGCVDTVQKVIIVLPEVILYAPNTFTPDDDEYNQDWGLYIEGIDIYNYSLNIYNRWGQLIWESKDPSAKWDGTYNGEIVPQGTYTWTIEAKDAINDKKYQWNGHINLIR